jgi:hypothetical protein
MKSEGLLLHSETPSTESYPEPDKSSPHTHYFPIIHVNSILLSKHTSSKGSSIAVFRQKSYMYNRNMQYWKIWKSYDLENVLMQNGK